MSLHNTDRVQLNMQSDLKKFLTEQFEYHSDEDCTLRPGERISPDRLFDMVTRSRFRRTKLDAEAAADIAMKVNAAWEHDAPIEFALPFGAYKHWQLPTYPYPDWAEVFNLKHMIAFAGPIAQSYPPGVVLNYTYTSEVLERVSNLPITDQNEYVAALKALHLYFQQIAPRGLELRLIDIRTFYRSGELEAELQSNYSENVHRWEWKYPREVRETKLQSARHNLVLTGKENLIDLTSEELEKRFLESAMWCDALDCLSLRRGFNKYGHCIQLVFVRGPRISMHIGSCRASNAHVAIGVGVVEQRDNCWMETIVPIGKFKRLLDQAFVKEVALKRCSPVPLPSLQSVFLMD